MRYVFFTKKKKPCFSKLQILFLCLAIVRSLSSPMFSMHHLKKLHLMLTPLLLCIRQNDNQNNQYQCIFFFINHSSIQLTLYFGHPQNCLPSFLTVVVVLRIAKSPHSRKWEQQKLSCSHHHG